MTAFRARRTVPVLRMFDEAAARRFWLDFMGFALDWAHGDPGGPRYLQISRAGVTLHLSGHHGDGSPGAVVFVRVDGLDALHAELAARNYPFNRPGIEPAPWGGRVMEVIDPSGNRLRLAEEG